MRQLITYFHQTLSRDRPNGSMQTIYGYRHYIKDLTYYVQFARVTLICLCLNTTTQINHLLSQVGIYIPNMHIIIVNFTHKNYCLIKITTYIFIYISLEAYIAFMMKTIQQSYREVKRNGKKNPIVFIQQWCKWYG